VYNPPLTTQSHNAEYAAQYGQNSAEFILNYPDASASVRFREY